MKIQSKGVLPAWLWPVVTIALLAVISAVVIFKTQQAVPNFVQMTPWLFARASGITALVLLAILVSLGLVLSSVPNKTNWRLTNLFLPVHRYLAMFLVFFLGLHVVTIILDPFAKVGLIGALVPGLSSYRSIPVAVGTLALYAIILTSVTARYPQVLPNNRWLTVHRVALVTFIASWTHGALTGSDTPGLRVLYVGTAVLVAAFVLLRYWIAYPKRSKSNRVVNQMES